MLDSAIYKCKESTGWERILKDAEDKFAEQGKNHSALKKSIAAIRRKIEAGEPLPDYLKVDAGTPQPTA
jgi:hypothetical protein